MYNSNHTITVLDKLKAEYLSKDNNRAKTHILEWGLNITLCYTLILI